MGDPNLRDFYSRVTRIEKARAHGYGFEAPGTLGLSHYHRTTRKRLPIIGPLFVLIVMSLFLKGAILYKIGETTYQSRVAELMAGSDFDKVGGWLMQADPATIWVSEKIRAAALAVAE